MIQFGITFGGLHKEVHRLMATRRRNKRVQRKQRLYVYITRARLFIDVQDRVSRRCTDLQSICWAKQQVETTRATPNLNERWGVGVVIVHS